MSLRLILAASAALAFAAPALAQEAPAAPPVAEAKSAAEIAMDAKGEAFGLRMDQMQTELAAAVTAAGTDQARGMADVDAILARYQPDIDAFMNDFDAFIDEMVAAETDEAERTKMAGAKVGVRAALGGIPAQMRAGAEIALQAQAQGTPPAAPAAPQ